MKACLSRSHARVCQKQNCHFMQQDAKLTAAQNCRFRQHILLQSKSSKALAFCEHQSSNSASGAPTGPNVHVFAWEECGSETMCPAGATVKSGQQLAVLSAMKMETSVSAPCSGIVQHVAVETGDQVDSGDLIVRIEGTRMNQLSCPQTRDDCHTARVAAPGMHLMFVATFKLYTIDLTRWRPP